MNGRPTESGTVSRPSSAPRYATERVRAVEQPELEQFVRFDVRREQRSAVLPGRPSRGEPVLHHPHAERFGRHRHGVVQAQARGDRVAVGVGGGRDDPVDHGAGERHRALQPRHQLLAFRGGQRLGELPHEPAGQLAVADEVVAAQDRHRPGVQAQAALQTAHDPPDRGPRGSVPAQVRPDVRGVEVETMGARRERVAVFRDGQGDDGRGGRRQRVEHVLRLLRRHQRAGVHGGDRDPGALRGDLHDRVAQVLLPHRPCHVRRPAGHPENAPGAVGVRQRGGRVHGLVGAVEVAESEVHDPGAGRGGRPRPGPGGGRLPAQARQGGRCRCRCRRGHGRGHQSVIEPSRRRATGR